MASYLRFLFGGGHSNASTTPTTTTTAPPSKSHHSRPSSSSKSRSHSSHSRSHHRSHSAPSPQGITYAYAIPASTSHSYGTTGRAHKENAIPHTTAQPSPLRYDATSSRERVSSKKPYARPSLQKMPLYAPGEHQAVHHPVFTHSSSSFNSSRTGSSSSLAAAAPARYPPHGTMVANSSSTSVASSTARRPALKQNHTWHASSKSGTTPRVAFQDPNRSETLNMHPLFASNRFTQAPISYDVLTTPSPTGHTILDRNTRNPVPAHTLSQPATDPPMYSRLILTSDRFKWHVIVDTAPKFFLAGGRKPSHVAITNLDVIEAIYRTLHTRVTQEEWVQLGTGSRAQRKATSAYTRRCEKMGGNPKEGVKRVDLLGEKTRFVGIEVDKNSSAPGGRLAKLVFGKAV